MSSKRCDAANDFDDHASWRLARVEVRTRIAAGSDVAARVELHHGERGRVIDVATGEGGIETAMRAIQQAMGVNARLDSLSVTGRRNALTGEWQVSACVSIASDTMTFPGSHVASDVVTASCAAYIDALRTVLRCRRESKRQQ